jgi:hypothetical protein
MQQQQRGGVDNQVPAHAAHSRPSDERGAQLSPVHHVLLSHSQVAVPGPPPCNTPPSQLVTATRTPGCVRAQSVRRRGCPQQPQLARRGSWRHGPASQMQVGAKPAWHGITASVGSLPPSCCRPRMHRAALVPPRPLAWPPIRTRRLTCRRLHPRCWAAPRQTSRCWTHAAAGRCCRRCCRRSAAALSSAPPHARGCRQSWCWRGRRRPAAGCPLTSAPRCRRHRTLTLHARRLIVRGCRPGELGCGPRRRSALGCPCAPCGLLRAAASCGHPRPGDWPGGRGRWRGWARWRMCPAPHCWRCWWRCRLVGRRPGTEAVRESRACACSRGGGGVAWAWQSASLKNPRPAQPAVLMLEPPAGRAWKWSGW